MNMLYFTMAKTSHFFKNNIIFIYLFIKIYQKKPILVQKSSFLLKKNQLLNS